MERIIASAIVGDIKATDTQCLSSAIHSQFSSPLSIICVMDDLSGGVILTLNPRVS